MKAEEIKKWIEESPLSSGLPYPKDINILLSAISRLKKRVGELLEKESSRRPK